MKSLRNLAAAAALLVLTATSAIAQTALPYPGVPCATGYCFPPVEDKWQYKRFGHNGKIILLTATNEASGVSWAFWCPPTPADPMIVMSQTSTASGLLVYSSGSEIPDRVVGVADPALYQLPGGTNSYCR